MNKKDKRHRNLVSLLNQNATMRVGELAEKLGVTAETVRRDLDEMAAQGLVNRTYGGAVSVSAAREPSLNERHLMLVSEREAIARAATAKFTGERVLMMGSGATTTHVARRIAIEFNGITVITHSFGVATVLSLNPTITVLIVPGTYQSQEGATIGAEALSFLESYQADRAIIGASGIDNVGVSDALISSGEVYTAMIRRANKTMIVADHSKFEQRFTACFAGWESIDCLVTDKVPSDSLKDAVEHSQTQLCVANVS